MDGLAQVAEIGHQAVHLAADLLPAGGVSDQFRDQEVVALVQLGEGGVENRQVAAGGVLGAGDEVVGDAGQGGGDHHQAPPRAAGIQADAHGLGHGSRGADGGAAEFHHQQVIISHFTLCLSHQARTK